MTAKPASAPELAALADEYASDRRHEPRWLRELRTAGRDHLATHGLPNSRDEGWRYTPASLLAELPLRKLTPAPAERAPHEGLEPYLGVGFDAARLVFVDGRLDRHLSRLDGLPPGVDVLGLADAIDRRPALVERHLGRLAAPGSSGPAALSTAFLADGAFIYLPRGTRLAGPVHLVSWASGRSGPSATHLRHLVVCEEDVELDLVEAYAGAAQGAGLTNVVTEIEALPGARVRHVRVQRESAQAFHLGRVAALAAAGASFSSLSLGFGARLSRAESDARVDAPGAEVELVGLSVTGGTQHAENHTLIDHARPQGKSFELYKAVLDDRSTGVFRGRILVRKDAQKTDSRQTSQSLVLSKEADMNARPELEIFADDVKCSHGATVGALDPDQLFFLRSRGIGTQDARRILIQAFARDVLNRVRIEPLRNALKEAFSARFAAPSTGAGVS